jgi:hypothetical protein
MSGVHTETSGVEDVLLQLGADGYTSLLHSNPRRHSDRHPINLNYSPQLVELPPPEIMDEIANLYFIHCHNQPYSVFHEQSFKIKLQAGMIAPEVQYCMLGMSVRCR